MILSKCGSFLPITLVVSILFLNEEVQSQTYPNAPDSTPPFEWISMTQGFEQHCSPFGVSIFAKGWPRDKFLHACNVMAQMLDNNQDGCADDVAVVQNMRATRSGMAMFATQDSANFELVEFSFAFQDLYADETELGCSGSSETANCHDAAMEEIMHVITAKGVGLAYPDDFSDCYIDQASISTMQAQMDIARGGHFTSVPSTYPAGSIYHYNDETCDYGCMGTEMIYWAITSLLNGQGKSYLLFGSSLIK